MCERDQYNSGNRAVHTLTRTRTHTMLYGGGVHSLKQNWFKTHITQRIPIPE